MCSRCRAGHGGRCKAGGCDRPPGCAAGLLGKARLMSGEEGGARVASVGPAGAPSLAGPGSRARVR